MPVAAHGAGQQGVQGAQDVGNHRWWLMRNAAWLLVALGLALQGCGSGGSSATVPAQHTGVSAVASSTVAPPTPLVVKPGVATHRAPSRPHAAATAHARKGHETLQTYGDAAAGAQRAQIASVVERYYAAYIAGDGGRACALASKALVRTITGELAKGILGKRGGCSAVLSALGRRLPAVERAELEGLRVTSARIEGSHGLAFIASRAIPYGVMAVDRQAGVWRVDRYEATTLLRAQPARG
jgi:hypothetical protein